MPDQSGTQPVGAMSHWPALALSGLSRYLPKKSAGGTGISSTVMPALARLACTVWATFGWLPSVRWIILRLKPSGYPAAVSNVRALSGSPRCSGVG